jgi:hypothetical protein
MINVSDTSCVRNLNTCYVQYLFPKIVPFNVEKYGRTRQVIYDNTAHALCLLDRKGYRHTLKFVILAAFAQ